MGTTQSVSPVFLKSRRQGEDRGQGRRHLTQVAKKSFWVGVISDDKSQHIQIDFERPGRDERGLYNDGRIDSKQHKKKDADHNGNQKNPVLREHPVITGDQKEVSQNQRQVDDSEYRLDMIDKERVQMEQCLQTVCCGKNHF